MQRCNFLKLSKKILPAALLLAAAPALADWRTLAPQFAEPIHADNVLVGADNSVWSFSSDGVRLSDAQGNTRPVTRHVYSGGQLLAGGGALLTGDCAVQRAGADGSAGWRVTRPSSEGCLAAVANRAGQSWIITFKTLYAIDRDGIVRARVPVNAIINGGAEQFSGAAINDDGSLVASSLGFQLPARLRRFNADGSSGWSWSGPQEASLWHLTLLSDGGIAAALSLAGNSEQHASLQRWSADGTLRGSLALTEATPAILGIKPAAGGDAYVMAGTAFGMSSYVSQLWRIDAGANRRWSADSNCARDTRPPQVLTDRNDGLALLCGEGSQSRLLRWEADGDATAGASLPLRRGDLLRLRSDGSLLALGWRASPAEPPREWRSALVVSTSNQVSPHPLDAAQPGAPSRVAAALIGADGSSYVASQHDDLYFPGKYRLSKIDAAGTLRWTQELDGPIGASGSRLVAGAGKVCIAERKNIASSNTPALVCLTEADGSLLFRDALDACVTDTLALDLRADGGVTVVCTRQDGHEVRRYAANGQRGVVTGGSGRAWFAVTDSTGRTSVGTRSAYSQYNADGTPRYVLSGASLPAEFVTMPRGSAIAAADGRTWAVIGNTLFSFAPDGTPRWRFTLSTPYSRTDLHLAGDVLYIVQFGQNSDNSAENFSSVRKVALDDGTPLWTFVSGDPDSGGQFALSADGDRALLLHSWGNKLRVQRIDTVSGERNAQRYLACAPQCGSTSAMALDAAGTLRIALDVLDESAGRSAAVMAVDQIGLATPFLRLDQPNVAGAWWAPYTNGQGFTFDWLADSRTFFGAWFTFTHDAGNEPAQQRWYTLQANNVPLHTSLIDMPILETDGGNFDAGPVVNPHLAGTATLRFLDCNNATLRYEFNSTHNGGEVGTISLTRLSPATQPCLLPNGSTQPGAGARPPQQGFDARMSGTWHEEATAGQGLQFSVQPGGVFFAPWFTYDPEGAADNPGQQHWFTLQGDLSQANNGSVELVLVQTTGGALDRVPTQNIYQVGTATLRMNGCDRASLEYRFGNDERAGAYANRSGTLDLVKIGGCAP
jgi:hypothetical protein